MHGGLDGLEDANVRHFHRCTTLQVSDFSSRGLRGLSVDVQDGDVGSLSSESQRDSLADPLAGAGHHDDLTLEHLSPPISAPRRVLLTRIDLPGWLPRSSRLRHCDHLIRAPTGCTLVKLNIPNTR